MRQGSSDKIAATALVNISPPTGKPISRAIPPIDAWTVAFGKYEITKKIFSLQDKPVFIKQISTPQLFWRLMR